MSRTNLLIALTGCLLILNSYPGLAQEDRTVTGKILSITIDDPTETKGLSKDAKRYAVRVEIDGVGADTVLGFGESGRPLGPQLAMLDLLVTSMERGWPVSLRLHREVVSNRSLPSHARIVSVSVKP